MVVQDYFSIGGIDVNMLRMGMLVVIAFIVFVVLINMGVIH